MRRTLLVIVALVAMTVAPAIAKEGPPGCKNTIPGAPNFKNPNCGVDRDGDGHSSLTSGGDDFCDDGTESALGCSPTTAPTMYPGAPDPCGDGIDQDGDGVDSGCTPDPTDRDGDGHSSLTSGGDDFCDDGTESAFGCSPTTAPTMYPGAPDSCGDGIDQNGDGFDPIC